MNLSEWLLIASLGSSLFVVLSQIGVIGKLKEAQELLELLTLRAIIEAEIRKLEDDENYGD
jgi:hypothetical protein